MAGKKQNLFFWRLIFLCYSALMLWLLFGQRVGSIAYTQHLAQGMNLTPFATLKRYWQLLRSSDGALVRHAFINLAGNVVMFIPLGYLLPRAFPQLRKFFKTLFLATLMILLIEAVQYFTRLGSCDVDDLILNIPGVILGFWLYRILRR